MCGASSCFRLAETLDTGRTWSSINSSGLSALDLTAAWHLRFANASDGWLSGPELLATHDGGHTWRPIPIRLADGSGGSIASLEAVDGRAFAVAESPTAIAVLGAAYRSDHWTPIAGIPQSSGGSYQISIAASTIWISSFTNTAQLIYRSFDGVTWAHVAAPCSGQSPPVIAAASRMAVMAVCGGGFAAGSQEKSAYLSTNAGVTFRRIADPPFAGDLTGAAASPSVLAVVAASGATGVDMSRDGGRTWSSTLSFGDGGIGIAEIGFTTASQGIAIHGRPDYPDTMGLFITRDAGAHWTKADVNA